MTRTAGQPPEEPIAESTSGGEPGVGELSARPPRRKWWPWLLAIGVVAVGLWLGHGAILTRAARLLIADGQPAAADYVWVRTSDGVSCDGDRCYDAAARLYHETPTRRIVLVQPYPGRLVQLGVLPSFAAITRRELESRGVPPEALIVIPGKAQGVWEEASRMRDWLRERPDAEVLLLCDRFGSGECRHVLSCVFEPGGAGRVRILALPDRRYDETNWWRSRRGAKSFLFALLSLIHTRCLGKEREAAQPLSPDGVESSFLKQWGKALP